MVNPEINVTLDVSHKTKTTKQKTHHMSIKDDQHCRGFFFVSYKTPVMLLILRSRVRVLSAIGERKQSLCHFRKHVYMYSLSNKSDHFKLY